jgi:hypothetical protein
MSAGPPEIVLAVFFYPRRVPKMISNKTCLTVFVLLLISGLMACGTGQSPAGPGPTLVTISIAPSNPLIAAETGQQFEATGIYSDNTTKDLTKTVAWSSSDPSVVELSKPGYAFGKTAGKAKIKASAGGISDSIELTVTPATLVSLSVTPAVDAIAKGTTRQFIAKGTFSDQTTQDMTAQVLWKSSDTGVATISNDAGSPGLSTGTGAGMATITAESGSVIGSAELTVNPAALRSISVTPPQPSIAKGTALQFTATGTFSDDSTQDLTAAVVWKSSDSSIATISSQGLASSLAAGTAMITASRETITGSAALTVNPATLVSLSVTPSNPAVTRGTAQQFIATGTFSDNTTQDLTSAAVWTSSRTDVATISNAAASKGLASSLAAGTAAITAASGSISATTVLTVNPATSVTLSWDAPTTNTDGTPLTDLAGYTVYYGTVPGNYTRTMAAGNATTITISNLSPGTHYFAVTSVNSAGTESVSSNEVSKTL